MENNFQFVGLRKSEVGGKMNMMMFLKLRNI